MKTINSLSKNQDKNLIEIFLKSIPLFKNISQSYLKQIVKDIEVIKVDKFQNVTLKSEEGTDLYIVLRGAVRVSLSGREGNELILTSFKQGDFFGEMSLIDGQSRSATITAEDDTSLGILKRKEFLRIITREPIIMYDMLTSIVQRLRKANDLIETLAFLDVNERLMKFMVRNAKENGKKDVNGFYRFKKIYQKDIAVRIGASREAVSKALKVLIFRKSIIAKGDYYLIPPDIGSGEAEIWK